MKVLLKATPKLPSSDRILLVKAKDGHILKYSIYPLKINGCQQLDLASLYLQLSLVVETFGQSGPMGCWGSALPIACQFQGFPPEATKKGCSHVIQIKSEKLATCYRLEDIGKQCLNIKAKHA